MNQSCPQKFCTSSSSSIGFQALGIGRCFSRLQTRHGCGGTTCPSPGAPRRPATSTRLTDGPFRGSQDVGERWKRGDLLSLTRVCGRWLADGPFAVDDTGSVDTWVALSISHTDPWTCNSK